MLHEQPEMHQLHRTRHSPHGLPVRRQKDVASCNGITICNLFALAPSHGGDARCNKITSETMCNHDSGCNWCAVRRAYPLEQWCLTIAQSKELPESSYGRMFKTTGIPGTAVSRRR